MSSEPGLKESLKPLEFDPLTTMNNFFMLFPLSEKERKERPLYDTRATIVNQLHREKELIGDIYNTEKLRNGHSQKWLNQTWNDFFEEIDKATEEVGISLEEISEMRDKQVYEEDYDSRVKLREEFNKKVKPIFERLLEKGYMNYDLSI